MINTELFPTTYDDTSLLSVRVESIAETGRIIDVGTAFWFRPIPEQIFLVTNWHIVTGRQPQAPKISASGAVPTQLVARVHRRIGELEISSDISRFSIPLNSADGESPQWLEHAGYRHRTDVVALKISPEVATRVALSAIGDDGIFDQTPTFIPYVTHDVFVIGFPWGLGGGTAALPIYKKGSIASEPGLPQAGLPRFLIDCRTARGMSGSPVIAAAVRANITDKSGNQLLIAHARTFAGIYSGRLLESELGDEASDSAGLREEAALAISEIGIVWRRDVLFQLVRAPAPGTRLSELF